MKLGTGLWQSVADSLDRVLRLWLSLPESQLRFTGPLTIFSSRIGGSWVACTLGCSPTQVGNAGKGTHPLPPRLPISG